MDQIGWMLIHLDDIESDMSAIHGIRDIWEMEAGRFFAWAYRLPYYRGVMRGKVEAEVARHSPAQSGGTQQGPPARRQPDRVVDLTPARLATDPNLAGLF